MIPFSPRLILAAIVLIAVTVLGAYIAHLRSSNASYRSANEKLSLEISIQARTIEELSVQSKVIKDRASKAQQEAANVRKDLAAARTAIRTVTIPSTCEGQVEWLVNSLQ